MVPFPAPGEVPKGVGSLYSLEADGTIANKDSGYTIGNGLAWSGDNRTFYFVDSTPRQIYAFDFDIETGALSKLYVLYIVFVLLELNGVFIHINYYLLYIVYYCVLVAVNFFDCDVTAGTLSKFTQDL